MNKPPNRADPTSRRSQSAPTRAPGNGSNPPPDIEERRRRTLARYTFGPYERDLSPVLADLGSRLNYPDADVRRRVKVLVGHVVARLIDTNAPAEIALAVEVKADSVRVDIWQDVAEPAAAFFEGLEEARFLEHVSSWGRDRRRLCGVWFEVA